MTQGGIAMARYLKYQTADGDVVLVEVESEAQPQEGVVRAGRVGDKVRDAVEEVQTRFEDAMDAVRHNAQTIIAKVDGLSDKPDEVEVTFGLKATGEFGNFAVAKAGAEANYVITMTWKREQKGRGSTVKRATSRQPYPGHIMSRSRRV
jgi:hypothetical protein